MIVVNDISLYEEDDLPQGSWKWKYFRENRVTASNAIYLLRGKGVRYTIDRNKQAPFDNKYTDRGHSLEFEVKERLNSLLDEHSLELRNYGAIVNSKYPCCAYSPDAIIMPSGDTDPELKNWNQYPIVEIKCYNDKVESKTGEVKYPNKHLKCVEDVSNIPISAIAQVQFGMMISEKDMCYLVLYNPDCEIPDKVIKVWEIKRDEAIITRLKEALSKDIRTLPQVNKGEK